MMMINVINGTDLTEYVVQLLQKHRIFTVREILDIEEEKLLKITNLSRNAIAKIQRELLRKHGPKQEQMSQLYLKTVSEKPCIFQTGIKSLDSIFQDKSTVGGCLIEVCGVSSIGKTQLCITTAVNFASEYNHQVLYIETKADFIGTRVYQILKHRNVTKSEMGQIMQQIKFQRIFSAESLINVLEQFLGNLKNREFSNSNTIKLVIIDSLPSLWIHLLSENKRVQSKYLLTRLANLMRQLSEEYLIAFQFVNLSVIFNRNFSNEKEHQCDDENDENDEDEKESFDPNADSVFKPLLGTYWQSVPTMRLSVEQSTELPEFRTDSTIRVIRVLKSCYTRTGETCLVNITNAGVVSAQCLR